MELIKVKEENGKKLVSARELHDFLEIKKHLTQWLKPYASEENEYGFIEGVDYQWIDVGVNPTNNIPIKDCALTVDMSKELSMLSKSPKGKIARKYFIECERDLNEIHQKAIEQQTVTLEEINAIRFKTPKKTCITFSNIDADFAKTLTKEFIEYAKKLPTDERVKKCQSAMNGLNKLHDKMATISIANIGDCYNINKLVEEIKDLQHKTENMTRGQLIAHRNTTIKKLEEQLNREQD